MKKILIAFITLFFLSNNVYASNIGYYKYNDVAMIYVEDLKFENAVLLVGKYSGNKLDNVSIYEIQSIDGKFQSERIKLAKNQDFRFYIFKDLNSLMPLYSPLGLNLSTPNGSGNSGDGEYTNPY